MKDKTADKFSDLDVSYCCECCEDQKEIETLTRNLFYLKKGKKEMLEQVDSLIDNVMPKHRAFDVYRKALKIEMEKLKNTLNPVSKDEGHSDRKNISSKSFERNEYIEGNPSQDAKKLKEELK